MTFFDKSFDYLGMLGLNPESASQSPPSALRDVVQRKRVEWTNKSSNPLYQQECRANLEKVSAFDKLLDEPEALHAYLQFQREAMEQLRAEQKKIIIGLVSLATDRNGASVSPRQYQLIKEAACEHEIPEQVVDQILRDLQVSVGAGLPASNGTPTLPYQYPATDAAILLQLKCWLKTLGKKSLYDVLDLPQATSPGDLLRSATILYQQWSRRLPKTTECLAWEKLLQASTTFLKDTDSKNRYDRALFNDAIACFVRRIDLLIDDGKITNQRQSLLAKLGVTRFGLAPSVVERCIAARVYALRLLARPLTVSLSPDAYVQCQRCLSLVLVHTNICDQCGNLLRRKCANPDCRQYVSENAAVCSSCKLPFIKGRQYEELLRLADLSLECGHVKTALDACNHAKQLIDEPGITERIDRARKLGVDIVQLEQSISEKRWSRAFDQLQAIILVAPHFQKEGIPDIAVMSRHMDKIRKNLHAAEKLTGAQQSVDAYIKCLAAWTDFDECYKMAFQLFRSLKAHGDIVLAARIALELVSSPLSESKYAAIVPELRKSLENDSQSVHSSV